MRDYITTIFNLIVGLVDAEKVLLLAFIGLGIIVVWQLISLLTNFHSQLARKCRKISKFLTVNGLSAKNYNNFLALVAKMPQEFIRGYKTFEHASYGIPSDYIKRFDSVDVETNGGMFNHGKSILKAFIYGYTIILALLGVALIGSEAITGAALAEALIVPILFLIVARIIYYIFVAIKQQQYKVAVDEFNEMLDIMNEKIENNDDVPGPDVLAIAAEEAALEEKKHYQTNDYPLYADNLKENNVYEEPVNIDEESAVVQNDDTVVLEEELSKTIEEYGNKDEKLDKNTTLENTIVAEEPAKKAKTSKAAAPAEIKLVEKPVEEVQPKPKKQRNHKPTQDKKVRLKKQESEENMEAEQKRGRGRPKKVPEGEVVITNDKEFEEALSRAEKLMRKSEEALSASQAKRVEKAIKELVDAMTAYKENH